VQALLMILIATGMFMINRYLEGKTWKPFYSSLAKLNKYQIESGEQIRFEPTDIDEFKNLQDTITALTRRNQQAYLAQKEFTENASHEMQSPLAVIQGKTELLMQTSPLTETQAELISDLTAAAQRMNRLNRSLLMLSKIENRQFPEKEIVNLGELISRLAEQFTNALRQKNILVEQKISSPVSMEVNRILLETMVGNLFSNAIRHNRQDGSIEIVLDPAMLEIRNTGKPSSLDTARLFKRFQKQSTDMNSTGLGLEIVKKICDLYAFSVRYKFENEQHVFAVLFHPETAPNAARS
jgi:signal transduction histidine kinase